ncbi:MAG: HAD family hydrolase [Candidatus Heimdallarchaeota archaeon]|nr:MAG: HAD family hydrolase [Candidatus Heimdallarchaeota archaeon]
MMFSSNIDVFNKQNDLLDLVRKEPTHRNYWNAYKKIRRLDFSNIEISDHAHINIALLSSFTIDPLAIYIDIDCRLKELFPAIYIAPFNRYHEEILNDHSGFYKFNPDVVFLFIELESLLDDKFIMKFPQLKPEDKEAEIDRIIKDIKLLLDTLSRQSKALIIFSNFIVPTFTPFGILDNKQEIGLKSFYRYINIRIEELFQADKQIYIFDLNEVVSKYGKDSYKNSPMYYRGSIVFDELFLPRVSYELIGYIKALKSKNRKCIVLDLDNTLWGGIIGEDGLEGIKLNVSYPGNEFIDFQRSLLSLNNRGIILAVNSKNNLEDAFEVFHQHPYMLIKENNLAAYRINWDDKVQNLIELAKELNIGLDSIVFFDDSPAERAHIQMSLPDVQVVDLPSSPALYRKTLEDLNDFNTLSLTSEDLQRSEMYHARRKRQVLEEQVPSVEEFIKSLEIVAKVQYTNEFSLPRVTSLINRTNQFNLTTRRYTENEIHQMYANPQKYFIYTLQVQDKFGDEGIVGVAIVRKESDEKWVIDSFLMSCRVIGRKIETIFLYKILKTAKQHKVKILEAEYIPTKKNSLVKEFYPEHGFQLVKEESTGEILWKIHPLDLKTIYPEYIQVDEE